MGVGIIVLLGVWGVTTWRVSSQLETARAGLGTAGFPTTWAGMKPKEDVPEEENRWVAMVKARRMINPAIECPSSSPDWWENPDSLPYPTDWFLRANASAGLNRAAIEAALVAASLPKSDLGRSYDGRSDPLTLGGGVTYGDARELACVLADEALRRHFYGDDAGALRLIEAILSIGDCLRDDPTVIGQVIGYGNDALAVRDLALICSRLRVGDGPGEVRMEEVKRLARSLARRDHTSRVGIALVGDVLACEYRWNEVANQIVLTRPIVRKITAAQIASAIGQDSAIGRDPTTRDDLVSSMITSLSTNAGGFAETGRRVDLVTRWAAVSVAIAAYRAEHGGVWPERLDMLVPEYLPEVPLDPHGKLGERIELRLREPGTGEWRPMIWARGESGRLFTERDTLPKPPRYGWNDSRQKIPHVLDLERYDYVPPVAPPTDSSADDTVPSQP